MAHITGVGADGGTTMQPRVISYWVTTTFIVLELLVGGVTDLVHGEQLLIAGEPVVAVLARLGYPVYLLTILGVWKLLGAIVLLAPRFPRLKEWAYAGICFELTGAAASAAIRGDSADFFGPLFLAAMALASWALRPQSRTLGMLLVTKRRNFASAQDAHALRSESAR